MTHEWWHGTRGGYTNHRCRCDDCKAANAAMQRDQREKRAQRLAGIATPGVRPDAKDKPIHGLPTTYTNWGCRCPACKAAHAAAMRNRTLRRKNRKDNTDDTP